MVVVGGVVVEGGVVVVVDIKVLVVSGVLVWVCEVIEVGIDEVEMTLVLNVVKLFVEVIEGTSVLLVENEEEIIFVELSVDVVGVMVTLVEPDELGTAIHNTIPLTHVVA